MVTPTNPIPKNGAVKLTLPNNIRFQSASGEVWEKFADMEAGKAEFIERCKITTSAAYVGAAHCIPDGNFFSEEARGAQAGKGNRALWFIGAFVEQEWYTSQF